MTGEWTAASASILILTLGTASSQAQKPAIDIRAADGVLLKGSYFSPGRPGPGIVLFHQCNMDRHGWDTLASDLVTVGFHVVTIDQRGFGASGGQRWAPPPELLPPPPPPASQKGDQYVTLPPKVLEALNVAYGKAMARDEDAAYSYLLSQRGVDKSRLAAGGASCGVTDAAALTSRHADIKALMLLSGDATGFLRHITATPTLAVFGAAARRDGPDAVRGIQAAVKASRNPRSLLRLQEGSEHGVTMFSKDPALRPMIVRWLQETLVSPQ